MGIVINLDTRYDIREKIGEKKDAIKKWCSQNKSTITLIGVPVVTSLLMSSIKARGRRKVIRETKRVKENYIYDHQFGHYWKLKKPLKPQEYLILEDRKRNGESIGQILYSMKKLK